MSDKTRIRRLPERGVGDLAIIHAILDEGFVCHTAYVTEGRPVIIPLLYVRDGGRLLLHGSNTMGVARAVREGSALCVAVTHIDGLVVARSAFNSSANYRSVVAHGHGRILTGDEKLAALDLVVNGVIPGRLSDLRQSTETEVRQTSVVELGLDEVSAKVRTGDPHDDPADMGANTWAGVLPFEFKPGAPIPAADLAGNIDTPDYLVDYRR